METRGHWSFIPFGISQDFSLKSRFPLANVEGSSNSELLFGPDIGEMLQLVQLIRLFTFGARGWDTCILLYNSVRGIETYTGESIGEFHNCSLIDLIGCQISNYIYIHILRTVVAGMNDFFSHVFLWAWRSLVSLRIHFTCPFDGERFAIILQLGKMPAPHVAVSFGGQTPLSHMSIRFHLSAFCTCTLRSFRIQSLWFFAFSIAVGKGAMC